MVHLFDTSKKRIALSLRNNRLLVFYSPAFEGCRWFIADSSGNEVISGTVNTAILKDIELPGGLRTGIYEFRIIDGDQLLEGGFRIDP